MKIRRDINETEFLRFLGGSLRTFRMKRKLTQEQLGELALINPKYIGEMERGEKNPTAIVLHRLAMAFDITLPDLFSFDINA